MIVYNDLDCNVCVAVLQMFVKNTNKLEKTKMDQKRGELAESHLLLRSTKTPKAHHLHHILVLSNCFLHKFHSSLFFLCLFL